MTLEELKSKATASELTLINAIESAVKETIIKEVKNSLMGFLHNSPPPSRDEVTFDRDVYKKWFERLNQHLNLNSNKS